MSFYFKKFYNCAQWSVYSPFYGRIGSVGQYFDETGKRRGFDAIIRADHWDATIGDGFETVGTGYKTRTEAAEALLRAYERAEVEV